MLYITVFLFIILIFLLFKIYSFSNYKSTYVYYDCIEDAIKHLAKNLSKCENKGKTYNLTGLILRLKKIKRLLTKLKDKPLISLEIQLLNNIDLLLYYSKKLKINNLTTVTHSKNKLRIFEIVCLMFDYLKDFQLSDIIKYINEFQKYEKLKIDELSYGIEAVILACLSEIDKNVQEYINDGFLKNKAKFEPLIYKDEDLLKLAEYQLRIENAINIIKSVKSINFIELSDIYDEINNEAQLIEINNLSRRSLVDERKIIDTIKSLQLILDKTFEEVLFDYRYTIMLHLKKKKYIFKVPSKKILALSYFALTLVLSAALALVVSIFIYFRAQYKLIILNYLVIMRISKFAIDKYFSAFLTQKCFTSVKNNSILYKSISIISIFSGVFLLAIFLCGYVLNDLSVLVNAAILMAVFPLIYFGERISFIRKNFFKPNKKLAEKINSNHLLVNTFGIDEFRSILFSNNYLKVYLDSFGNNKIYFLNEKIKDIFIYDEFGIYFADIDNTACQYFAYKDELKKYSFELSLIYAKYINLLNGFSVKIFLGLNNSCVIYDVSSKKDFYLLIKDKNKMKASDKNEIEITLFDRIIILTFNNVAYVEIENEKLFIKILDYTKNVSIYANVFKREKSIKNLVNKTYGKLVFFANETKFILQNKLKNLKDINFVCQMNFLFFNFSSLKNKHVFINNNGLKKRIYVLFLKADENYKLYEVVREVVGQLYVHEKNKILILTKNQNLKFVSKNFQVVNVSKLSAKSEQKLYQKLSFEITQNNLEKLKLNISNYLNKQSLKFIDCKESGFYIKNLKNDENLSIFVKNPKNLMLCTKSDIGYILNYGFFKFYSKNRILYDFKNLFVIYEDKIINLGAYILKSGLIWNYLSIKSVVNIENDIFEVIIGILPNNVCFYIKILVKNLSKSSKFCGILLDLFSSEIMDNLCDVYVHNTSLNEFRFTKSNFAGEMKFKVFSKFEYSFSLSSYMNFDHTFIKFEKNRSTNFFKDTFVMYFSRENILKSEQNILVVFADKTNLFNLFDKNFLIENKLNILNQKIKLFSVDTSLNYLFNNVLLYQLNCFVNSKWDNNTHTFNSIAREYFALEALLYLDILFVKDQILMYFSKVFYEGDVLDEFVNCFGKRNYSNFSIICLIHLLSKYMDFTKDYEFVEQKVGFLYEKDKLFLQSDESHTISAHLNAMILFLKNSILDAKELVLLYKALNMLKEYIYSDLKEQIICLLVDVKKQLLDKYQHNYFSLKNTDLLTIFEFLNLKIIDTSAKLTVFEDLKLKFSDLNLEEKIQYIKLKSVLNDENAYCYDYLINPIKNSSLFLSSAHAAYLYFELILNEYLSCNLSETQMTILNPKLISNQYRFRVYKNIDYFDVIVKHSIKNEAVYIDSKKVENLEDIDILSVKKNILILRKIY